VLFFGLVSGAAASAKDATTSSSFAREKVAFNVVGLIWAYVGAQVWDWSDGSWSAQTWRVQRTTGVCHTRTCEAGGF
jgi:hypothetical protein